MARAAASATTSSALLRAPGAFISGVGTLFCSGPGRHRRIIIFDNYANFDSRLFSIEASRYGPGLLVSIFVWKLREPKRGEHDPPPKKAASGARQSWWRTTKQIFMTRDWLLSTAGYTALTFVLGAFATW